MTVHPRTVSQINQLGAQFCLSIFIYFSSQRVSDIQVPIMRRKLLYQCDTITCHSVCVVSGWIESNQHTRGHPYRVTNSSVA